MRLKFELKKSYTQKKTLSFQFFHHRDYILLTSFGKHKTTYIIYCTIEYSQNTQLLSRRLHIYKCLRYTSVNELRKGIKSLKGEISDLITLDEDNSAISLNSISNSNFLV